MSDITTEQAKAAFKRVIKELDAHHGKELETLRVWANSPDMEGASPMTLYDELVELFREHRLLDTVTGHRCLCEKPMAIDEHAEHLAALACERARQVGEDAIRRNVQLGDHYASFESSCPHVEEHMRWLIAALGEVKRG